MKAVKLILKAFLFLILISAAGIAVKLIFFPDEDARIRKTLSMVIEELEKKQINEFIRHFTLDYRDGFDNTYGTLYIFLKNNINMCKYLDIDVSQVEIEREKSHAIVKFFATAYIETTDGERYKEAGRFELKMRKEDFKWRIYRLDEMEYEFD
ncbi:MAG TPA: hypothetical protein PK303_05555 [bacterium]|nr:hypothetical protein [bacterium]HOL35132.1 hypothetical protein [bacterium]HPP08565.1 hypothetical protein [bacterium]